ncbi:MAG: AAA family ATPase [Rhodocyclales bacterium]|nr:AAA family ATPase [Rhodocyclales bacterium]
MSFLYLKHFDLEKSPFQITPDIDFFFSGSQRGGILTALLHVASHEEGIVTAVAEVGSGKTLLARLMISRLPDDISTVYLANPCFSRDEIISAISRDLGLATTLASTEENLAQLHQELLRRHSLGQRVLLVIDEAHAMPPESLEEVRLLSNLETDRHKLVNIMLFGQPELDTLLTDRRLRQVRDRVIHRFELPPLPRDEAMAYIDHRLRIAGWRGGRLFTSAAISLLLKASQGRARRINLLADKSLLAAYAEGARQVEKRHVQSACSELHPDAPGRMKWALPGWKTWAAGTALALPITAFAVGVLGWYRDAPPVAQSREAAMAPAVAPPSAADPVPSGVQRPELLLAKASRVSPDAASPPAPYLASAPRELQPMAAGARVGMVVKRTEDLLNDPKWKGFTLQLASLPSMEHLPGYLDVLGRHLDPATIYAHDRKYKGKNSVAVYLGQYPSEQQARQALTDLPETLKVNQPIVRTWAGIRQEPKP